MLKVMPTDSLMYRLKVISQIEDARLAAQSFTPAWRIWLIALTAKSLGVTVTVSGSRMPLGSDRLRRRYIHQLNWTDWPPDRN